MNTKKMNKKKTIIETMKKKEINNRRRSVTYLLRSRVTSAGYFSLFFSGDEGGVTKGHRKENNVREIPHRCGWK